MTKTIIFGATGTVGAYCTIFLKERGYDVVAVGRRESDNGFFQDHNIPYHSVDIQNQIDFEKLLKYDVGNVLHFASLMPATMKGYDPRIYIRNIIEGTLNVLEFCRNTNADRIIFSHSHADTSHLQGSQNPIPSDIQRSFPHTGDHSVYAICKNAAVDLIEHYYYQYGLKRFVLRLPTIYAYTPNPYYYVNGETKMMAYRYIIERARRGELIEIWGDPRLRKEIVYVEDCCQIVEKATTANVDGGMYNVGRGSGVSLEEQIQGIIDVFCPPEDKSEIQYRPDKPNPNQFIHDISKPVEELDYHPEYDYIQGLKKFKEEMELNRFAKLWGDPPTL